MISVFNNIAGIVFRTDFNSAIPYLLEERFEKLCVNKEQNPDVINQIHIFSPDSYTIPNPNKKELSQIEAITRSCAPGGLKSPLLQVPSVRGSLSNYLERCKEEFDIRLEKDQIIISDFSLCRLIWYSTSHLNNYPATYYIAANLKKMFSTFLPVFSAVLIHSSGVLLNSKASIFLANGDGGKTTTVRLAKNKPILSDDYTIWRKDGEIIQAHPTPFGGISNTTSCGPIGGLFYLEKGQSFNLMSIDRLELTYCLLHAHRYFLRFLPRNLKIRAFEIISEVCRKVPAYRLRFPKDHMDWDAVEAAMAN